MEGEAVPAVLSRDRWSVPGALAAGTRGPRAPLGVVLGAGARVHPTLLVHHPLGWCPGPVVGGFAPGTQPVSRAGEYSGCGVVWCGVVWCGVVWCGVWCGVVWCGVVWCGVVWCGVVWCGVVWCGVPKALLPKGKRPGCLSTGTGKRAGLCVLCARCA